MRHITAAAIAAILIASPALAEQRRVEIPAQGPWQMIPGGTSSQGIPSVFLLNTETGDLRYCAVVSQPTTVGCVPVQADQSGIRPRLSQ